ncbi:hypothetical protein BDE36_1872 [Arcticibacter tournemirensis]|uniref:Late embryogenesis abundant protein LEA-2 subgroup domain-containing protein n=1 Tax=Arcticibacter tournemirensis TaxID=699437 RepID=A0A5M9H9E9_9SPHI|nr:hypothetical protein [Arcticibacter tournemirensis]KAA8481828.1 hypothetical protein F1649_13865 [Arcticibacter tournemirensis]TQM50136.1 hypothetical protein BDE36_1872 [Arcticibacter tournemirensis]
MQYIKKLLFLFPALILLHSCGIDSQVKRLEALEGCTYSIVSADSVYLANTDISRLIRKKGFDLSGAPAVAFAFMQQTLPLKAVLRMKIENPGKDEAGINEFDYKIVLKGVELTSGSYNRKIVIAPEGGTADVALKIDSELYPILSNPEYQKAVTAFLSSEEEMKTIITLMIKPSFTIGNEKVSYPGYIDINKEVSNKQLLSFLGKNQR